MRRLIADTIISLDGYFATVRNDVPWYGFDGEEWAWSGDILRRADATLYGRYTYEEFRQVWGSSEWKKMGLDQYTAERLNDLPKLVFSKSLGEAPWKPATLVREDPAAAVAKLKQEPGKDLALLGSGTLVASLLRAGLIDDYFIRVRPVILGGGRQAFVDPGAWHRLKLVESKVFRAGTVGLHYEPAQPNSSA